MKRGATPKSLSGLNVASDKLKLENILNRSVRRVENIQHSINIEKSVYEGIRVWNIDV